MTKSICKISIRKNVRAIALMFLSVTLIAHSLHAKEKGRGNLVTVDWLNKNLKNTDLILLDASPAQVYAAKHIPGAISYDIFTYGVQELPVEEIEKRYQSWGISLDKKIVMYDQGGTYLATRLLFSLDYYGFPTTNLYILDGGLSKWQEAGLPVTNEPTPSPKKGTFTIKKLNTNSRVDLPEFLEASGNPASNVLLEALDPNWHFGSYNIFGRPGHVPNAIMLPADDFYNPDKTFKSDQEIKQVLAYLGIHPEQKVLSHCGGGIAASVPFFALKYLLGYSNVKLFPGSLLEWAADQRELPLWTYDEPYLIRDASWLQGWGGRMMRMYGISQLSFLDVRSTEVFRKGHVQYALNVPAGVFEKNIKNPNTLSQILGSAGVDINHEAVIFSGGGLTKEAALAFVILETLGQKKISVFMDPSNKWAQLGFTVLKDTTVQTTKNAPQDLSKPAKVYTVNLRKDILITDLKSTQGIYPKTIIASGKNVPAQVQGSKVVHVLYTDLSNADGTPKEAKDIWNILTKAGVPRYAELVCTSDDVGEAAVNYVILKLMGYPDVKLLKL